ncbi:MAG: hypothetical protein JKX69_01770 [Rhodobacteraceae bacterium]|nr:hypothetical protein [Paracoccaceae bacterium]
MRVFAAIAALTFALPAQASDICHMVTDDLAFCGGDKYEMTDSPASELPGRNQVSWRIFQGDQAGHTFYSLFDNTAEGRTLEDLTEQVEAFRREQMPPGTEIMIARGTDPFDLTSVRIIYKFALNDIDLPPHRDWGRATTGIDIVTLAGDRALVFSGMNKYGALEHDDFIAEHDAFSEAFVIIERPPQ